LPLSAPPGALLTNGEGRATLAACRGLNAAGYRVSVIAAARPAAAHWTRSCSERLRLPDPVTSSVAFIDGLEQLVRTGRYAVLLPGSDGALLAISCARERLEPYVRIGLPSHAAVEASLDKLCLVEAAATAGLRPPTTAVCETAQDASIAARRLSFPVVLKPRRSIVDDADGRVQVSTLVIFDESQLAELVPTYGRPFLVQARERGVVYSSAGVMAPKGLLALLTSRYRRTWPPEGGEVAFSETVQTPHGLREAIGAMLSELGWQGLFELEMIRRADGSFAAIDLNPRLYGSLALATAAGAPLPAIWCDWILTGRAPPSRALVGLMYRWEEGDLRHFLWQLRRRQVRQATEVVTPHRRLVHAYFRADDPGPLLARALHLAKVAWHRRARTISTRSSHTSPTLTPS
jgi:predicted ATP-grasp superfamily ATP-dependent carboligase